MLKNPQQPWSPELHEGYRRVASQREVMLDADNDGVACENNASGGTTSGGTTTDTTTTADSGVALPATGAGAMAGGTTSTTAIVLVALAAMSALAAGMMRTRRT